MSPQDRVYHCDPRWLEAQEQANEEDFANDGDKLIKRE